MSLTRRPLVPHARPFLDAFKVEIADELGLSGRIQEQGWAEMTTREVGQIGGQMVRRLVQEAREAMHNQTR